VFNVVANMLDKNIQKSILIKVENVPK